MGSFKRPDLNSYKGIEIGGTPELGTCGKSTYFPRAAASGDGGCMLKFSFMI
jgi:hypothetical protein